MKHLSVDSIRICTNLAEVFVESCFAVVDKERKMIRKRSVKSQGIYS